MCRFWGRPILEFWRLRGYGKNSVRGRQSAFLRSWWRRSICCWGFLASPWGLLSIFGEVKAYGLTGVDTRGNYGVLYSPLLAITKYHDLKRRFVCLFVFFFEAKSWYIKPAKSSSRNRSLKMSLGSGLLSVATIFLVFGSDLVSAQNTKTVTTTATILVVKSTSTVCVSYGNILHKLVKY